MIRKYIKLDFKVPKDTISKVITFLNSWLLASVFMLAYRFTGRIPVSILCIIVLVTTLANFIYMTNKYKDLFAVNGRYKTYVINQVLEYAAIVLGLYIVCSIFEKILP